MCDIIVVDARKSPRKTSGASSSSTESSISTKGIQEIIQKLKREKYRDSTKQNYYKIWQIFNRFFIRLDAKPATWENRILLFTAHLIDQGKKSTTVKSYISATRAVLADNDIEPNEDS